MVGVFLSRADGGGSSLDSSMVFMPSARAAVMECFRCARRDLPASDVASAEASLDAAPSFAATDFKDGLLAAVGMRERAVPAVDGREGGGIYLFILECRRRPNADWPWQWPRRRKCGARGR